MLASWFSTFFRWTWHDTFRKLRNLEIDIPKKFFHVFSILWVRFSWLVSLIPSTSLKFWYGIFFTSKTWKNYLQAPKEQNLTRSACVEQFLVVGKRCDAGSRSLLWCLNPFKPNGIQIQIESCILASFENLVLWGKGAIHKCSVCDKVSLEERSSVVENKMGQNSWPIGWGTVLHEQLSFQAVHGPVKWSGSTVGRRLKWENFRETIFSLCFLWMLMGEWMPSTSCRRSAHNFHFFVGGMLDLTVHVHLCGLVYCAFWKSD